MNDLAIRARHVCKVYRLYDSPNDRLIDLIGLLPNSKRKVRQHIALQDVSFDIARGEKVGIIGRNGAGKSTLLKMITRVTEPSSGVLEVHGKSRALLQIGTGFHPDFTGRQNVAAYLASLGVEAKDAKLLIEDAVAFAELEDFADQPVKTYSTGMGMRLMFAASTMMKPDLLVIDEVLGVGDAYFQRKSFERIREMCAGRETTLLLVTHDIYSAAALCDRMIWIDRGRVLIDADPATVTRAYEDAMREQEERRLRAKALSYAGERGEKAQRERIVVEIQSKDNQPPPSPVWFSRLSLLLDGAPIASLAFGEDAFEPTASGRLQCEGSNWSDPEQAQGRLARSLKTYGSPFHKVAAVFEIDALSESLDPASFAVAIDYLIETTADLRVSLTSSSWRIDLGALPPSHGEWRSHQAAAAHGATQNAPDEQRAEDHDFTNWDNWSTPTEGAVIDSADGALDLSWHGAAGPYLYLSEPIRVGAGETLCVPVTVAMRSGRLGFGALNEGGQWVRTYEFEGASSAKTLEFPSGDDGTLTLVLYSAIPEPLATRITHGISAIANASVNTKGVYGAGDIRLEGFRVLDGQGHEAYTLEVGAKATFELTYAIMREEMRENAQIVLAFKRHGVEDVFRVICRELKFDTALNSRGVIACVVDPLPIGPGNYSIAALIAAEGYYDRPQTVYFSINPEVYYAQSAAAEIVVTGTSLIHQGTAVVGDAHWRLHPASDELARPHKAGAR